MMKPSTTKGSALDGLPKQFVTAMRTLFDLMDDKRTGYVKFSDLEAFWSEEGLYGLPKGVLDSLRKVTPSNGLLSFERFCGGLKICLLRLQVSLSTFHRSPYNLNLLSALDLADPPPVIRPRMPTNTATVRPTSSFPQQQQRTSSLPQLDDINIKEKEEPPPLRARKPQSQLKERRAGVQSVYGDFAPIEMGQPPQPPTYHPPPPPQLLGPPKPPRTNSGNLITNGALMMKAQKQNQDPKAPEGKNEGETVTSKPDVRTALQQWQMAQMTGYMEKSKSATVVGGLQSKDDHANVDVGKKNSKRREPRRHTLQNGIDYNMVHSLCFRPVNAIKCI
nr:EOG090X08VB [Triops cancriformis]